MAQEELKLDGWVSCFNPTYHGQMCSGSKILGLRLTGQDNKENKIVHASGKWSHGLVFN
jgi:hypothetical protein